MMQPNPVGCSDPSPPGDFARERYRWAPAASRVYLFACFVFFHAGLALGQDPQETSLFSDDFQQDSRPNYKISGEVKWERGALTLHGDASVQKNVQAGGTLDLTVELRWPAATEENSGQQSTRIDFRATANAPVASVALKRAGAANDAPVTIDILQITAPSTVGRLFGAKQRATVLRSFSLPPAELSGGTWRFSYRHGLLKVTTPAGQMAARGYVEQSANDVASVSIHSTGGEVDLLKLTGIGSERAAPLSPEQRRPSS